MEEYIKYVEVSEQIKKLKKQGLIIPDEKEAASYLEIFGYSNLIKSYRSPYIIYGEHGISYRSGVSLYQILSLYSFDKNLRNSVMASLLDLEEHIKEVTADIVAKTFGTHQDDYLQFNNYKDKRRRKKQFTLNEILKTLHKTTHSDKDPIKHYREKYGAVPPWILFKNVYLSTIVNFLYLFKPNDQLAVANRLYDNSELQLSSSSLRKLMMDTLFLCQEYRNLAAHGGRMYNYEHFSKIRTEEIFQDQPNINLAGFSGLLKLLGLFKYDAPYKNLLKSLEYSVNKHFSNFPEDVTYLGQILNIDFVRKDQSVSPKK